MSHQDEQSLCKASCGFYGNPSNGGYCSKCFNDAEKLKQTFTMDSLNALLSETSKLLTSEQQQQKSSTESIEKVEISSGTETSNNDLPQSAEASTSKSAQSTKSTKPKCAKCGKRVGVISFTCRCGGMYCGVHRYASAHDCTFDYREEGAQEISKKNPKILGDKIKKL